MKARARAAGFSLVQVSAAAVVMLILLGAAVPTWKWVMKNDREEELIFRGGQIADAIVRFQKKNGNAMPVSLEVLVKGKFLRQEYKDPMTKDGKWRLVRPNEVQGGGPPGPPGPPQPGSDPGKTPPPSDGDKDGAPSPAPGPGPGIGPTPGGIGGTPGPGGVGPLVGVASLSRETSLRTFNGKKRYSDWLFVAGQKRVVGNTVLPGLTTGAGAGGSPAPGPPPGPGQPPMPPVPPGSAIE